MKSIVFSLVFFFQLSLQAGELLSATEVLPELIQLGINPRIEKLVDPRFKDLSNEEDKYYLDIQLGQLTLTQYQAALKLYGSQSQVPYNRDKNYSLIDLLPPSIQAVSNQVFKPHSYDLSFLSDIDMDSIDDESIMDLEAIQKMGLNSQINCWNTTIENLNLILFPETKNYYLYLPGRWAINDLMKSVEYSDSVNEENIRLWDALLVNEVSLHDEQQSQIQHTALIINKSLVFEKTDSSENDPIRISLRKDVVTKYQGIFNDRLRIEYRRYGKKPLSFSASGEEKFSTLSPSIIRLLKKNNIDADFSRMVAGCEDRLGGGCDLYFQEKIKTELRIYPKTHRGILFGKKSVLDRFSPLKGF